MKQLTLGARPVEGQDKTRQLRPNGRDIVINCKTSLQRGFGKETKNESVPKIIINDTRSLFFITAISILVISNRSSFRVLFAKIAFVYFI